jgi:GH35 family endo-1,4-beta-xylanase
MNRRTFLKTAAPAGVALFSGLTRAADPQKEGPGDDAILAQTRERVETHRKSDGTVTVRGAGGQPVAGAKVKIEQIAHDFLFGCNFFMFGRCREPQHEADYRQRFAALHNYATLGFYWGAYEPQRGQPHYDYTDSVVDWCRQHGITCKGHPLAWDHPASSPRWLPSDLAEVERLSTERVRAIVTRFKGRINIWDVVNEPTDLTRFKNPMNTWAQKLGAVPFTRLHLQRAREANPTATLLVNDYRVDSPYAQILGALREDGKPLFDAIGIQSHMHGGAWSLRKVWEVCDTFGRFGVPIHFTETTLVSGPRLGPGENWGPSAAALEDRQAADVAKFYAALFSHPAVRAITWWDFSDQGAWQRAAAGLLRKDMSPKPAYDRLHHLVKGEWWTNASGRTDAEGRFATRAFFGRHRLTAELPNGQVVAKEVHWARGEGNRFDLAAV